MSGAFDGVRVSARTGRPIGHMHRSERRPDAAFGGRKRNRPSMAAGKSLHAVYIDTRGVAGG